LLRGFDRFPGLARRDGQLNAAVDRALQAGLDGIGVPSDGSGAVAAAVAKAKAAGMLVASYPYGVWPWLDLGTDSPKRRAWAQRIGVDIFATNWPNSVNSVAAIPSSPQHPRPSHRRHNTSTVVASQPPAVVDNTPSSHPSTSVARGSRPGPRLQPLLRRPGAGIVAAAAAVGRIILAPHREPACTSVRVGGFVGRGGTLWRTPQLDLWGLRCTGSRPSSGLQRQRATCWLLLRAGRKAMT